jgi:Tol biopolymer transport system component/DNA-binding winged helix-turn-helix (wHTH) protein
LTLVWMAKGNKMKNLERFGPFSLERSPLRLRRDFEIISLTTRQLETLELIVSARGRIVPKEKFFEVVWKDAIVEDGNLTQTIFLLRKALGRLPDGGEFIETVSRQGYRLAPTALVPNSVGYTSSEATNTEATSIEADQLSKPAVNEGREDVRSPFATILKQVRPGAYSDVKVLLTRERLLLTLIIGLLVCLGLAGWNLGHVSIPHPTILRSVGVTNDGMQKSIHLPLLLNGDYLYVNETIDNLNYLALYNTDGERIMRIPSPVTGGRGLSIVHEPYRLLFGVPWDSASPFTVLSASGGASHLDGLSGRTIAVSPDENTLAVIKGRQLLLADQAGGNVRTLATLPNVAYWPEWSPDGKHIRLTTWAGDYRQSLLDINVADGSLTPLLAGSPHEHTVCCGSWSSDGKYFVYVVDEGYRSSLWIRDERRNIKFLLKETEQELVSGPVDFWNAPIISHDNKRLYAIGHEARGELIRLPRGEGSYVQPLPEDLSADTVTFSRDGHWIAYTLFPGGSLWRSRPDGSEKLQLSRPGRMTRAPQWSPDSANLVYQCAIPGEAWQICEVSVDGLSVSNLTNAAQVSGVATFSAKGDKVAYGQDVDRGFQLQGDIFITIRDIKSGQQEKLSGSEGLYNARWSPDGRYIAATASGTQALMLLDFQTGHWSKLTDQSVNDLIWSPDSKTVFFDTRQGADNGIFAAYPSTGKVEKYCDAKKLRRTGFPPWRLSVTPDGVPVVLQQAGMSEVYRFDIDLP